MKKTIYHGSEKIIEKPIFGYGKRYNDYGLGFYCTYDINMAKEWGISVNKDGYANIYEIETNELNILNLNTKDYCILHWLTILLKNRDFSTNSLLANEAKEYLIKYFSLPLDDIDIIIGYRADDSYFSFAQDFISGVISYHQLKNAMMLGKLGEQFVLISKKAFDRLVFKGYEIALANEWYSKKDARDTQAREDYFNFEKNGRKKGDIYITNILDEEMKPNDPRL